MNRIRRAAVTAIVFASLSVYAFAADVAGQWTSTFDTQIGEQHYTYTFKVYGEKLTGTAKSDTATTDITDGKVKGDDISFVETFNYQGQPITITYAGKISGDEIKFTRTVGEYGTEDLVAKRVK